MLRAREDGGIWTVIKFNTEHTCEMDLDRIATRHVFAKVIAKYFLRKLINEGAILKLKDMIAELLSEFGI